MIKINVYKLQTNVSNRLLDNDLESDEEAFIMCILLDNNDRDFIIKFRPWHTDYFEKFRNHEWAWKGLSANEQVVWSTELLEKYMDKWDFNELARNKSVYQIFKQQLSVPLINTIMTSISDT